MVLGYQLNYQNLINTVISFIYCVTLLLFFCVYVPYVLICDDVKIMIHSIHSTVLIIKSFLTYPIIYSRSFAVTCNGFSEAFCTSLKKLTLAIYVHTNI